MKCTKAKNLFSPWLDGELGPVEAGEFRRHIAGCASCRGEFSEWREISGVMRGMAEAVTAPAGFAGSVRAQLDDIRPRRFSVLSAGWRRGLAAAAALVVVASASLGLAARLMPLQSGPAIVGWDPPGISTPGARTPVAPAPGEVVAPPAGDDEPAGTGNEGGTAPAPGTAPELAETVPGTPESNAGPSVGRPAVKESVPEKEMTATTLPDRLVEPKAFLDKERKISSTLLKVAVGDLPAATEEALALAGKTGAEYQELAVQNAGGRQIKIIRFTAPPDSALPVQLAGLGTVTDKQSEVQDVTSRFTATLEKYRELLAQQGSAGDDRQQAELRARTDSLERQLNAWDQEAEKQVITLWLEAK
ncbi:MAG: hypothetical protein C4589_04995 [Peptococcaceae bacterium]|nr:MAG: hypothetical protein C4589_04995 [Peptococcaceae bacterium]